MSQASLDFEQRQVLSVTQLNREARGLVETHLGLVWIEGEISNLARPSSGHLYFSLKDDRSQVRCALFRQHGSRLSFKPENGLQVLAQARVSLYEARGEFQLLVQHMEPAGEGALQRAFEALKKKLAQEGLFDAAFKGPIPTLPRRLGVITSPSGAALRDILNVTRRRFPAIDVLIYPVAVQGDEAKGQIVSAFRTANERRDCDVLILARGGGSLEDLWAFNEEVVARAIFDSEIPVVSGVGHEVDFTISDLVADARAPTPSAAAEMVTPDKRQLERSLTSSAMRIHQLVQRLLDGGRERLNWLGKRLQQQHPGQQLSQQMQRIDELEQRLRNAQERMLLDRSRTLAALSRQLFNLTPMSQIFHLGTRCVNLKTRLINASTGILERTQHRLALAANALHQVSPLATLDRGYAILTDAGRRVIHSATQVQPGDTLTARLAKGELETTVTKIRE